MSQKRQYGKTHSIERLHELLALREDGTLVWRTHTNQHTKPGSVAGYTDSRGYVCLMIDQIHYQGHRVVFAMANGYWPMNNVDHINGVKNDNRPCNLRDATNSVNAHNIKGANKNNHSGYLGVSKDTRIDKWYSRIKLNGKTKWLGTFDTPELAHEAYVSAKRAMHEGNTL